MIEQTTWSDVEAKADDVEKAEKEGDKKEERSGPPPVSFFELFRFMSSEDRMLFALGCVFACCAGVSLPAINVAFGE